MKREEIVDSAERSRKILKLTKQSMYDRFTDSINLSLAKQNAQKIYEMNPTHEELGYVRETDGLSLLHLAIFSHNPYLVALYRHLGLNPDFHKFESGITPRSLILKTGHLVHGMRNAFFTSDDFLRDAGILKDSTIEKHGRFEIQVLNEDEEAEATKETEAVDASLEAPASAETPGLSMKDSESASRDLLNIFSSKGKRFIVSFEEPECSKSPGPETSLEEQVEVPTRLKSPGPSLQEQTGALKELLDIISSTKVEVELSGKALTKHESSTICKDTYVSPVGDELYIDIV